MTLNNALNRTFEPITQDALQHELNTFRPLLPRGAFVAAAVRENSHNMFLVSFRARLKGKTVVAAARDFNLDSAIHHAASAFHRMLVERKRRMRDQHRQAKRFFLDAAA